MNAWPLASEWLRFAGTLTVELAVVFAAAKLFALAVKPAQAQRAIWQVALCSALLIFIGELNGVSRWVPVPHTRPASHTSAQRAVVITLKDGPNVPAPAVPPPAITAEEFFAPSSERHLRWPAVLWIAGSVLVVLRLMFAEVAALVVRCRSRRIDVRADATVRARDSALAARVSRIAVAVGVRREVRLLENSRVIAPFTFGTRKPAIVLPRDFANTFTPAQQDAVLAHELAHVAGRDSTWRRFGEIVCALLWWHPAVWIGKRELHHASELVADEASFVLGDGPQHLAECLLVCAKRLRRPALFARLGIDGGGFRSKLGKRVARLLETKQRTASARVPWPVRFVATIGCVFALWYGTAMATVSNGNGANAWRHSILGAAFAALAEPPTKSNGETHIETARLIQNGKLAYEAGRLSQALTNLTKVLEQEPENKAARYYRELVEARKYAETLATTNDTTGSKTQLLSELPYLGKFFRADNPRQVIHKKLQTIRLREFMVDKLPLGEVIKVLSNEVRRLDPDPDPFTKGVHFLIRNADPAKGEALDLVGGVTVTVSKPLRDISVEEALNVITSVADKKIRYSIEDFGVVISAKPPETVPLHTRFFKVDMNTFWQGLSNTVAFQTHTNAQKGTSANPGTSTNAGLSFLAGANASAVIPAVKLFFQAAGVDLNHDGKAIFFNDRLGYLMVRATLADLETIEKVIQMLNVAPPQISIQVKAVEVEVKPGQLLESFYPPLPLTTNMSVTNATITGILTGEQFRSVIHSMEERGGTEILSCPEVTTMSGRQAQIKVVDVRHVVTGLDVKTNETSGEREILPVTEPFETGPVVDVVPYVETDGYTVLMTVLPTVREFLGYRDPHEIPDRDLWAVGAHAEEKIKRPLSPIPLPHFRVRQLASTARVLDGHTVMLSGGRIRDEQVQNENGSKHTNYVSKALFFFITPRLIDNAGNPLHSDEALREIRRKPRSAR